jgi:hypothetical protein
MNDCVQGLSGIGIVENQLPQSLSVEGPGRVEHVGPKFLLNALKGRRSRLNGRAGENVRIDYSSAPRREDVGDGGFPRSDTSSESDNGHATPLEETPEREPTVGGPALMVKD